MGGGYEGCGCLKVMGLVGVTLPETSSFAPRKISNLYEADVFNSLFLFGGEFQRTFETFAAPMRLFLGMLQWQG